MKQFSYSGKCSLSASRAHEYHLQFSFVVGDASCPRFLHVKETSLLQKRIVDEIHELY